METPVRSSALLEEVRWSRRLPAPNVARMIRVAAGVSQQRLAAELCVHRMTVVRWESGERVPRGLHRVAYAQILEKLQSELAS